MASNGKKKTTMAKMNRENKVRERRVEKAARKDARKQAALNPVAPSAEPLDADDRELAGDRELAEDRELA
jgi:hypothetical protein